MRYTTVKETSLQLLEEQVNEKAKTGYMPTGSIFTEKETVRGNKEPHNPVGDTQIVTWYIQPLFRAIPEAQVAQVVEFNMWDEFITPCTSRKGQVCMIVTQAGVDAGQPQDKMVQCNPSICPKPDKPKIEII